MNYIFQRIIKNDFEWLRPSPGRLGKNGEGDFVKRSGFGHEDWNFNDELIMDNHIYGYTYYTPSENKKNEEYNIAFAVYDLSKWHIVGFYQKAQYVEKSPLSNYVLQRKTNDLLSLGNSLGKHLRSKHAIITEIKNSKNWLHWKVNPQNIIRSIAPIEIPKSIFYTSNFRIVKPTNLSKKQYDDLFGLIKTDYSISTTPDIDLEFPEGKIIELQHKARERNPALIKLAKENYRNKCKSLDCQVCGFSFIKKYGEIGEGFIEAHHAVPLSNLSKAKKTKIEDIILVCSNCHRMLHRKRPWLTIDSIKELVK